MKQLRSPTASRKDEHIKICLENDVKFSKTTTGFEEVKIYDKISNFSGVSPFDINLETKLLNRKVKYPIIISGITGGTKKGKEINQAIAQACNRFEIGMGVGSQRSALENKNSINTFQVREYAPNIPLFGNIGIGQIKEENGNEVVKQLTRMIDADGIAIHINKMQELIQFEGDKTFINKSKLVESLCKKTSIPLMIKGVGYGLSEKDARRLVKTEAQLIDIAGAGGTNWTRIELLRNKELSNHSESFIEWGIPTVESLQNIIPLKKDNKPSIVASGGVWGGLKAVKALLLGADYIGFALPILKAFDENGSRGIERFLTAYIKEMRITMAMLGLKNLKDLKEKRAKILD